MILHWFHAHIKSYIAPEWNMKHIQIFTFLCCLYVNLSLYPTTSNRFLFDTRLRQSNAAWIFVWAKKNLLANEWSNFTVSWFLRQNFRICHFSGNLELARQRSRITLLAYISGKYALRVICSTSLPGGNQVDGLPPASSLTILFLRDQFFPRQKFMPSWMVLVSCQIETYLR